MLRIIHHELVFLGETADKRAILGSSLKSKDNSNKPALQGYSGSVS